MPKRLLFPIVCLFLFLGNVHAQNKEKKLLMLFDTLAGLQRFNGCVLVAEQGQILFQHAYGVADYDTKRLLINESVFELASVSKGFTAMGIMQLMEKGLLSYNDSLSKFFPELPFSGISIRNLLTHTSGLPDFLRWNDEDIDRSRIYSNRDIIEKLTAKYLTANAAKRSEFYYSNTNYVLLASIIEKVSGLSFSEYMHRNIFTPAGMTNTFVHRRHHDSVPKNYAFDYTWDGSRNTFVKADSLKLYTYCMSDVFGAYGISSSTGDLYKWDQAILSNKLISAATKAEAFSPIKYDGSDEIIKSSFGLSYVYGWELLSGSKSEDMFASGNYGGYTSLIVREVSKGRTVILLSNFNEVSDVMSIINNVADVLDGESPSLPGQAKLSKGIALAASELRLVEGVYVAENQVVEEVKITLAGNNLYLQVMGSMAQNIFPESADTFFLTGSENKLRFVRDKSGRAEKLILIGPTSEIVMTLKR